MLGLRFCTNRMTSSSRRGSALLRRAVLLAASDSASAMRPSRTAPTRSGTRPKKDAASSALLTSDTRPSAM